MNQEIEYAEMLEIRKGSSRIVNPPEQNQGGPCGTALIDIANRDFTS